MKYLFSLVSLALTAPVFSQNIETRYFGKTTGGNWSILHSATLPDGSWVGVGTSNTADTGGYHVLMVRTNPNNSSYSTTELFNGKANYVATTPDGGFILGGLTEKTPFGKTDGFVTKTNSSGTVQWTTLLNLPDRGEVNCVQPLHNGGYVFCGTTINDSLTGQDVCWGKVDTQGNLIFYQELKRPTPDKALDIFETHNGDILLIWQGYGNHFTRFQSDGQLLWDRDVKDFYLNGFNGFSVAENAAGDLFVAGEADLDGASSFHMQVLRVSSDGALLQRTETPDRPDCQPKIWADTDGKMHVYYNARASLIYSHVALIHLVVDPQGNLFSRDSFFLGLAQTNQISIQGTTYLHLLERQRYENEFIVKFFANINQSYELIREKYLKTPNEPSTEFHSGHCRTADGGYYVLSNQATETFTGYKLYGFKTDDTGNNATTPQLLANSSLYQQDQYEIKATPDGGVLINDKSGFVRKINKQGIVEWTQQVTLGTLLVQPDNGFAIIQNGILWSPEKPSSLARYNSIGGLTTVKPAGDSSLHENYYGGVSRLEGGFILWGKKEIHDGELRNHVLYLNANGDPVHAFFLDATSPYYDSPYNLHFLRTSTGGMVVAGERVDYYQGKTAYLLRIENGQVLWQYSFADPDSNRDITLNDVEEIPGKGFVLDLTSTPMPDKVILPAPKSETRSLLHLVTPDGRAGNTFSYYTLPTTETSDTAFVPGYTFRQWGDEMHGQTRDVYFRTITFPAQQPAPSFNNTVGIYPNPSANEAHFQLDIAETGRLTVEIYTANGQLLDRFFSEKLEKSWKTSYAARYPAGNYVVQVSTPSGKIYTGKWQKGQ